MIRGLLSLGFVCMVVSAVAESAPGTVRLSILDRATGEPVAARVHVKDASGRFVVADDALRFGGDCDMSDAGAGYTTLPAALAGFSDRLENPYTGSTQFYADGRATLTIAPGTAEVAVYKGPEYRVATAELEVGSAETADHTILLDRWIDMPARGWYSADDHVHIQRPHPDLNPRILKHMQAEDIHVANLLQMGKVLNFEIAPQYRFGEGGHYQQGNHILAAGQENPRTHYLGHTITLGAPEPVFDAERYLIYRHIWEATAKMGGLNGFAHAAFTGGGVAPYDGGALLLPHDLLHFLEVLQFNRSGYQVWYDILNLGHRVTPTAGTDYPCADQNIAGHERFYTRVDGELTYAKWLAAVRAGHTFVTTGPILTLTVAGRDIGAELVLDGPAEVRIQGGVSFNPERDDVGVIELVQNGELVTRVSRTEGRASIDLDVTRRVDETSWFALRAYGSELSRAGFVSPFHFAMLAPTSNAHTGATYVTLKNHPGLKDSARARSTARAWLARLDDLERTLAESNLQRLGAALETPNFDGVPPETLRSNRDALLAEIATARKYFAGFGI